MAKMLTSDDVKKIVNDVIDEKHVATKDDLISFKDVILKEIRDLRDDVAIVTGYRDMIEDHDERIEVLEKKAGIPQN
ncbi:MAG TPA: hypothetical protein VMR81_05610 [Patescibacteria group bacterium]|nr:hypothetical protein [Patescibacteria group bacterium]